MATLTDEIVTPGEGQIKALVTVAGNPVLSTPGGQHLEQALDHLDFQVAIDIYVNETTRHAEAILPPTWPLLPMPMTTVRPGQANMRSTACVKPV